MYEVSCRGLSSCPALRSFSTGEKGDVEAAKDIARNTRGPVASIYYQGLMRIDQGTDQRQAFQRRFRRAISTHTNARRVCGVGRTELFQTRRFSELRIH